MDARSERSAVETAVAEMRRAAGCVTSQPVRAARQRPGRYDLSFAPVGSTASIRIQGGLARRGVELKQEIDVAPSDDGNKASIAQYSYRLIEPDGREILAYHLHPDGLSSVKRPHLHVSSRIPPIPLGDADVSIGLSAMHLATGFVSLDDFIRLLIEEFDVEPRRAAWRAILEGNPSERSEG